MNIENITEEASRTSQLEKLADSGTLQGKSLSSINEPIENPYASGFDKDHPMPTYDQLRNAGFSDNLANQILYGTHSYSDKELFNVLYSPDPVSAYNQMMESKVNAALDKSQQVIDIHKNFGI